MGTSRTALFLIAASLAGCQCGRREPEVAARFAEIGLVWNDGSLERVDREATYDFGPALVGERIAKKLVIRNLGSGPLTLLALERQEGDPVTVGGAVQPQAAFEVGFLAGQTIWADEEAAFDMFFTPNQPSEAGYAHHARLLFSGEGTRPGEDTATLHLKGSSASSSCDLPRSIDFGKVAVGQTVEHSYEVGNRTAVPTTGSVGEPFSSGSDHLVFSLAPSSPKGSFPLPAGGSARLTFQFTPTELRPYLAAVKVRAAPLCPEVGVSLQGEGTDTVLTWSPAKLDFGPASAANPSVRALTFLNSGQQPIRLTQLGTTLSDFAVKAPQGADPTVLEVPPGSVPTELLVACSPAQLGPKQGQLTFQTGIAKLPSGAVPLKCYGGGPKITLIPSSSFPFGKVAYLAGSQPPYSVVRKLTVMNTGASVTPPDPSINLRLGRVGPYGPGVLPYFSIQPLNSNTVPDEFSVGVSSGYDPALGLEAGKLLDLPVTLTPRSAGTKEAELTIFSNDPNQPQVKIKLTADAVVRPPCNYSVTPAQLNFGLVTPPNFRELVVTVKNLGQAPGDLCLVSDLELAPGSDPAYSLLGGPVASKELQPNEAWPLTVKVWPQGQQPQSTVTLLGHLQFNISSPQKPQSSVLLSTSVGPVCLAIAPDSLDFGTVKKGCSSATRGFNVYNNCSQSVTITSFAVQAAAGQPAGGPDCPGPQPCPEFILVQSPVIPSGGLVMPPGTTPRTFQAKYAPIDLGSDSGAIAVNAIQGGQNVTYLVTLQGTGDTTGLQQDIFLQDARPKADILFTIDSSCSMGDEQTDLANNFASFITYANSTNADYHLGVTTCDDDPGFPNPPWGTMGAGPQGRLLGDANNPKVLTPSTPGVEAKFKAKVKVGTDGSAFETGLSPSLKALTAPLVTGENAGFLRYDAYLAVVVVTDAMDQDSKPVSWFYNQFMNIKGVNRANLFTFSAIGPFNPTPPSGCYYDGQGDDGRYAQMVSMTKGVKEEICNPNWAQALQDLGKVAFGYRTSFFLNSAPDTSAGKTIEVKVDGVASPSTDWSYDPVANAIVFATGKEPGPGKTITVSYYVACL